MQQTIQKNASKKMINTKIHNSLKATLSLIAIATLCACGGGAGGATDTSTGTNTPIYPGVTNPTIPDAANTPITPVIPVATPSTGKFIDSAVSGIRYSTATQNGMTNDAGEFQYMPGETVTFSIGAIELPPVLAKDVLTPLDIAERNDPSDQKVVNMLVLLQSLDEDSDPANGIKIPAQAHTISQRNLQLDVPSTTFTAHTDFAVLVQNAATKNRAAVTLTQAKQHFNNTLTGTNGITKVNVAPVAKLILTTKNIYINRTLSYYKNQSFDPNNDVITYKYTLTNPEGKSWQSTSTNANASATKFDKVGTWKINLQVTDSSGLTSKPVEYEIKVYDAAYLNSVQTETNPPNVFSNYLNNIDCAAIKQNGNIYSEKRALPLIIPADVQQTKKILYESSIDVYNEYLRMPNFYIEWVRASDLMNKTNKSVYLDSLTKATHEIHHFYTEAILKCDQDNINSIDRGNAKFFLNGEWNTTDIKMWWSQNGNYSATGATYSAIDAYLPQIYKNSDAYRTYVLSPKNSLRAESLIDELTAYTKASKFAVDFLNNYENYNLRSTEFESNSPLTINSDIAVLPEIMLYVQCYIQEMRNNSKNLTGTEGTYNVIKSERTRIYLQKIWTLAELVMLDAYKHTYNKEDVNSISNRQDWSSMIALNYSIFKDIYSSERIAEMQSIGVQTKNADFWKETYLQATK